MAAYNTALIAPLVAELAASRQTIERQADTIAELREDRGRQKAELERAASTVVALNRELERLTGPQQPPDASGATQAPDLSRWPSRLWGRSWVVYGAIVLVVLVVVMIWMVGPW